MKRFMKTWNDVRWGVTIGIAMLAVALDVIALIRLMQ